jgi:hypothetical protein
LNWKPSKSPTRSAPRFYKAGRRAEKSPSGSTKWVTAQAAHADLVQLEDGADRAVQDAANVISSAQ